MFHLGWHPDFEKKAKAAWTNSPKRLTSAIFTDVNVSEPSFTLANQVYFWFNQGPVGSCFANATAQSIQISMAVAGLSIEQLSRSYVWYYGRQLDGLLGSANDGGSITNAMRAINEYGIPLESQWPYKPDHNFLETPPTPAVVAEAKAVTIKALVDVDWSDSNAIKKTIKSGYPPVCGIWWPYGWDTTADDQGRVSTIGSGEYGHALCIIGWATWNGVTYWHILNSHGPIYHNLTTPIPGYVGSSADATYAFWVPDNLLKTVVSYGNAELVAPVTIVGPTGSGGALNWNLN